jgi:predicted kinase
LTPDLQLIVFAGLPGTGKTSLARAVARELRAVYLDKDTLRDAVVAVGRELKLEQAAELARPLAYALLVDLARDNLSLGLPVVLDSPARYSAYREQVEQLARNQKAELKLIECICTDESQLRERVERREGWESYQRERATFERLTGPRLVVDTAESVMINVRKVLTYLGHTSPEPE